MAPAFAGFVAVCSALAYVGLSAHLLSRILARHLLPVRWTSTEPGGNRLELILIEIPIALFVVTMTQLLMLSLALDQAEPPATRILAATELGLAAVWTAYALAVASGVIPGQEPK